MNILICYTIINYVVSSCLSLPTNVSTVQKTPISNTNSSITQENVIVQKINELAKQKDELFRQINKAMEDSVTALKNSNVTNAEQGVSYIEHLKMEIKNIADADNNQEDDYDAYSDMETTPMTNDVKNNNDADTRRKNGLRELRHKFRTENNNGGNKKNKNYLKTDRPPPFLNEILLNVTEIKWRPKSNFKRGDQKFLEHAITEIDSLLNVGLSGKRLKDRMERREKMKQQLEKWYQMRLEERKKIRAYKDFLKLKYGKIEVCPRRGYGPRLKLSDFDHTTHADARFPCCRKCCKYSYLGCLK